MEIKDIRIFLKKYIDQDIIYIPNPGNAGDSLIVYGTLTIFDEIKLKYSIGSINKTYNNKLLIYGGGGNLVGLYKTCYNFLKNNKDKNKIIILPHTIKSEDDLLSSLNDNIIIICREIPSYDYVKKIVKYKNNVYLSKDMAFYIKNIGNYIKIKGNGICNVYRRDCERTNIDIPSNNVDLSHSLIKYGNTNNITIINEVSISTFEYLSKFEVVNTNRLHIAIVGSLLNKIVNLYSNSYYKNKAVYEYSIKNVFQNTTFMGNQILIKGFRNEMLNGEYERCVLSNVDKNTQSYYKDDKHQIYRYNNKWRIAHHGKKVWIELPYCENKDWDIDEIDFSYIHILKPIVINKSVTYSYLYNGEQYSFTNKFLSNEIIYTGIEGLISIFVPHCILTGKTIFSEIPVDKTFIDNLQNLVPIFRNRHNNNNLQLNIDVPIKKNNLEIRNKKRISTFTLGVDSFYTLYSNIDKLDAILFIIGFDITVHQKKLLNETIENLKKVAEIYNKKLILCETDLKNKINHGKGFDWGHYFFGPALFNIVYCLNDFQDIFIPSSHLFEHNNYIGGSQYILDKNYSSSFLNILHNGDLTRVKKIKFILDYDLKCLNFLRVCWQNINSQYNCTKCEKCFRTLYVIEVFGYKDKAITFDRNVNGKKYWDFNPRNASDEAFQKEIKELEDSGFC